MLLLLFLFIIRRLYSLATRVPPYQLHIVPRCNERYHKISMWGSMTDKRQLMILEGQNWTGTAGESVLLSSCINEVKIIVYIIIQSFLEISTACTDTCTSLHDGLHKSNYFIYFAIMNILCFYLKTQFEMSDRFFFDGLKCIHYIGFESTSIDICWHPCSRTQRNTSSTIPAWKSIDSLRLLVSLRAVHVTQLKNGAI